MNLRVYSPAHFRGIISPLDSFRARSDSRGLSAHTGSARSARPGHLNRPRYWRSEVPTVVTRGANIGAIRFAA
jgi:hypothetical protein